MTAVFGIGGSIYPDSDVSNGSKDHSSFGTRKSHINNGPAHIENGSQNNRFDFMGSASSWRRIIGYGPHITVTFSIKHKSVSLVNRFRDFLLFPGMPIIHWEKSIKCSFILSLMHNHPNVEATLHKRVEPFPIHSQPYIILTLL